MSIRLGANQYGKSENRLVRIVRDTARHEIRDLTVSSSLRGDFEAAHVTGDQSAILTTDAQKNTVFAFAKERGVGAVEEFGIALATHLLATSPVADGACVTLSEHPWARITADGREHDHSFYRTGDGTRTAVVNVEDHGDGPEVHVVSGIEDLTILKSTGSEFRGFLRERFTTLPDADDRILATSLVVRWRYAHTDVDWDATHRAVRALLLEKFAVVHSLALQHTLYEMGEAVLEAHPEIAEIRFVAPNKHHFVVDLQQFGIDNPGEVFIAADRPYGLIEASVVRDDEPVPAAWHGIPELI